MPLDKVIPDQQFQQDLKGLFNDPRKLLFEYRLPKGTQLILSPEQFKLLLNTIEACSNKVQSIRISCLVLCDQRATELAAIIRKCRELECLDLAHNRLSDAGATAIATALDNCEKLVALYLSNNDIGDLGATALARTLVNCPKLGILALSSNRVGDAGATGLANALANSQSLVSLCMNVNSFGDVGATALIRGLEHCPTLVHLGLYANTVTQEFKDAETREVKHNQTTKLPMLTFMAASLRTDRKPEEQSPTERFCAQDGNKAVARKVFRCLAG